MEWIELAQDRDQWRVLVNTVMNLFGFLKIAGNFPEWLHNCQLFRNGSTP
jgi:hypothetical protein